MRGYQSPVKNALLGNLVRTLLIQVQKTKVRKCLAAVFLADFDTDRSVVEYGEVKNEGKAGKGSTSTVSGMLTIAKYRQRR